VSECKKYAQADALRCNGNWTSDAADQTGKERIAPVRTARGVPLYCSSLSSRRSGSAGSPLLLHPVAALLQCIFAIKLTNVIKLIIYPSGNPP
jgi:hypothetical protein